MDLGDGAVGSWKGGEAAVVVYCMKKIMYYYFFNKKATQSVMFPESWLRNVCVPFS